MASVGNALGIFQSLPGIWEQPFHLLLTLDEKLTALIAHPVLIRQLFVGLETQQDVVGVRVLFIGIMDIVGGH